MNGYKDGRKLLRGAFPRSLQNTEAKQWQVPEADIDGQCFAVASHGEVIKRFKLMTRDGSMYSVPYSLLPIFILSEGKELVIKAHDIMVDIHGRNLDIIEDHLSEEQLLWLKESPSGKDDDTSPVFIERMEIKLSE